jgi:hypothetical protein
MQAYRVFGIQASSDIPQYLSIPAGNSVSAHFTTLPQIHDGDCGHLKFYSVRVICITHFDVSLPEGTNCIYGYFSHAAHIGQRAESLQDHKCKVPIQHGLRNSSKNFL